MRMRPVRLVSYAFLYTTSVMRSEKVSTNHCCIPAPMHENFRYQNFLKRQIFCPCEVSKNFMLLRVMSRFSVENFLSHSAEKFRRGILWSFIIFGYRKSLDETAGECQDFTSKNFCLAVPKNFVGESFSLSLILGIEKVWMRRWGVSRFSVEKMLSRSAEKFRWGTVLCCVSENFW